MARGTKPQYENVAARQFELTEPGVDYEHFSRFLE